MTGTVIESVTVSGDLVSVPLIVWRRFGRPVPGLVETIYDINPGLADLGPYPPPGTVFQMPVTETTGGASGAGPEILAPIKLW